MIKITQSFKLLTPCLAGGSNPEAQAEITAKAVRAQLRWWFRVLGGFKDSSLPTEQELFGGASDNSEDSGSSMIIIRISHSKTPQPIDLECPGGYEGGSYILFPLRQETRKALPDGTEFNIAVISYGPRKLRIPLEALLSVFANLGALGSRSRRGMGALEPLTPQQETSFLKALGQFRFGQNIEICELENYHPNLAEAAFNRLGDWLKSWRQHGRTTDHDRGTEENKLPPFNAGFHWAENDHDIGYGIIQPQNNDTHSYRPALGLPIVQAVSPNNRRVTKTWNLNMIDPKRDDSKPGRFASPIILRPHKSGDTYKALVIFVESKSWVNTFPEDKKAHINSTPVKVSSDLYEKMKNDQRLSRLFPKAES